MLAFDCPLNYCSFGTRCQEGAAMGMGITGLVSCLQIHKYRIIFYKDTAFPSIINTSVVYVRWVVLWSFI